MRGRIAQPNKGNGRLREALFTRLQSPSIAHKGLATRSRLWIVRRSPAQGADVLRRGTRRQTQALYQSEIGAGLALAAEGRDRAMNQKTFTTIASVIFGIVTLLQLSRIFLGWSVAIDGWMVPMWFSWIALVVAGGMSYFGISLARKLP